MLDSVAIRELILKLETKANETKNLFIRTSLMKDFCYIKNKYNEVHCKY